MTKIEEINKAQPSPSHSISSFRVEEYLRNIRETLSLHPMHGKEFIHKIIARVDIDTSEGNWQANISCRQDGLFHGQVLKATAANDILLESMAA